MESQIPSEDGGILILNLQPLMPVIIFNITSEQSNLRTSDLIHYKNRTID